MTRDGAGRRVASYGLIHIVDFFLFGDAVTLCNVTPLNIDEWEYSRRRTTCVLCIALENKQ